MIENENLARSQREELAEMAKLKSYCTVDIADNEAALLGMIRIAEQGVSVFRVTFSGRLPLYGEWNLRFEPNGYDFDITVLGFGYANIYNVGNTDPKSKTELSDKEGAVLKGLLDALLHKAASERSVFPLTSKNARFTGLIKYEQQWIEGIN